MKRSGYYGIHLSLLIVAPLLLCCCGCFTMFKNKDILTKKELSSGYRQGTAIYFLCEYSLFEKGTTIIPLYAWSPGTVYFHAIYLYEFDITSGRLTQISELKSLPSEKSRGSIRDTRWARDGSVVYLVYHSGRDGMTSPMKRHVYRITVKDSLVEEVSGEKGEAVMKHFFSGNAGLPGSNGDVLKPSRVWYYAGCLQTVSWRLPMPTEFSDMSDRESRRIIIEERGDRYLREAVFSGMMKTLDEKAVQNMTHDMEKWMEKLPRHKKMIYGPYREEWKTRLSLQARYGIRSAPQNLEEALFLRDGAAAEAFLRQDPAVNRPDGDGRTAMMIAAYVDDSAIVKDLLRRGADINARDNNGCTPLMYAIFGGAGRTMELLLQHGAETKLETRSGWTAWMFVSSTELRERYLAIVQ